MNNGFPVSLAIILVAAIFGALLMVGLIVGLLLFAVLGAPAG